MKAVKRTKSALMLEHVKKNPSISPHTLADKFMVSLPYAYMVMKRAKSLIDWKRDETPVVSVVLDTTSTAMNPLDVQISGSHYKDMKIRPVEFITANNLTFLEGCIVKRISRWRSKDGLRDLEKIKHEVDLLIELEGLK